MTSVAISEAAGLRLSPEAERWRLEVRRFLDEEMAPENLAGHLDPSELTGLTGGFERSHHRRAGERGFLGISLPPSVGGGGRPPSWKAVYDFEAAYHDAPSIDTGVTLCGHALSHHGSPAQHRDVLSPMVTGTMTACIAYTEPAAGSDLAALRATARRTPDGWSLDGHKTLVTGGHRADVGLTLVRTDPHAPSRSAMTMFLVPMATAGVRITRRPTINGWTLEDIEFAGVELGDDQRVGEVGDGWAQVLGAIGAERAGFAYLGWATRRIEELADRIDDPRVLDLVIRLGVARRFGERVLRRLDAGEALGHTGSVAKLVATELLQRIAALGAELAGSDAAGQVALFGTGNRFAYEQLERVHGTIGAGTSEIQRDTIARMALGLR